MNCIVALSAALFVGGPGVAFAQEAPVEGKIGTGYFLFNTFYFFALVYLGYYFLVLRPKVAQQSTQGKFLENLKKGDEVVTTGGIYARVISTSEDSITLEVDRNVRLRVQPAHVLPVTKTVKAVDAKSDPAEETRSVS
ncbi:MAG: preprotein translocase subunit YajC [Deltaproteobacteria bacterium]|nr:preprotein translocase subunit YajC [Deltaproteobacteria bacterium]